MNTNPITDIIEFIAPYEDELYVLFLGDITDVNTINSFKKKIKKLRNTAKIKLPQPTFLEFNTSALFRNKAYEYLHSESCLLIFDDEFSNNIIHFINNKLNDPIEAMLIDKFLFQIPQEKCILDITTIDDDALNELVNRLDQKPSEFNYLISANYLAIWVTHSDEFTNPLLNN